MSSPAVRRRVHPTGSDEPLSDGISSGGGQLALTKQAVKVIEEVDDAINLVSRLDFRRYRLDDPYGGGAIPFEPMFGAIAPAEIAAMINRAAARVLTRAKPHLEFERPVMLAIDITYVAYYGSREGLIRVEGAPDNKDYEWCYKFATANVVGDNVYFTAGMLPVGNAENHDPDAYPGEDKTYRAGEVVRNLLDIVDKQSRLSVHQLSADREFHSADVIDALTERGIYYAIPARRDDRIKRFIARMDERVTVEDDWVTHGPVKDGVTNDRVETTLVVLPADEDRDAPQPFVTNLVVDDEIRLDRRTTATRERIESVTYEAAGLRLCWTHFSHPAFSHETLSMTQTSLTIP